MRSLIMNKEILGTGEELDGMVVGNIKTFIQRF